MQIRDQTADLIEKYSWDRGHGRLIESRNIPKHGWTIKTYGDIPSGKPATNYGKSQCLING